MEQWIANVADIIKEHRQRYNITQVEFSANANMANLKKLSELEQHKNGQINAAEFFGIARALDMSPGALAVKVGIPNAVVEPVFSSSHPLCLMLTETFAMLDADEAETLKEIITLELKKCQQMKRHIAKKY